MTKPRIMFLCSGNSARSQMAEGLTRDLAGDQFEIVSAGTEPTTVNRLASKAMLMSGTARFRVVLAVGPK